MLTKLLNENLITFEKGFPTWEEAIAGGAKPLVEQGKITPEYIQAMIDSVNEFGPYIVIAPNIAMPHSQLGATGVNETAISLMVVEEKVSFDENDASKDARIFITLAAVDQEKHMENIMSVAEVFADESLVSDLIDSKNLDDIKNVIVKYNL
jgi:PTS system ascorbate-specific IIA component